MLSISMLNSTISITILLFKLLPLLINLPMMNHGALETLLSSTHQVHRRLFLLLLILMPFTLLSMETSSLFLMDGSSPKDIVEIKPLLLIMLTHSPHVVVLDSLVVMVYLVLEVL